MNCDESSISCLLGATRDRIETGRLLIKSARESLIATYDAIARSRMLIDRTDQLLQKIQSPVQRRRFRAR